MKHFEKIRDGIDIAPYAEELSAHPEVFQKETSRQQRIAVQRETQAALLFGVDVGDADRSKFDYGVLDSRARIGMPIRYRGRPTPESETLPTCAQFVRDLCSEMRGVPGRAVIARLAPDGKIYKHIDDQLYWLLRDRYHLVIKCGEKGTVFRNGDEEACMRLGELWWFDPTVYHEAHNVSGETRIHLLIDILSPHSLGTFLVRASRAPIRTAYRSVRSLFKRYRPPEAVRPKT